LVLSTPGCLRLFLFEHGFNTACITKLFPTRSHTVAAQVRLRPAGHNSLAMAAGLAEKWISCFVQQIRSAGNELDIVFR
jgi:hypothetical protein